MNNYAQSETGECPVTGTAECGCPPAGEADWPVTYSLTPAAEALIEAEAGS
jgi:hypothetical protein